MTIADQLPRVQRTFLDPRRELSGMNVEEAGAVADGLDIERPDELVAWLRSRGLSDPDERPIATVLHGGAFRVAPCVSRRTGVTSPEAATDEARVPIDWFSDPACKAHREATRASLDAHARTGRIPMLVFEDRDGTSGVDGGCAPAARELEGMLSRATSNMRTSNASPRFS